MTEYPRLVALCGPKGSGKTTLAKLLVFRLGYQRIPFAESLKLMLRVMLHEAGASHTEIDSMLDGDKKEVPTELLCGKTPRYAMQRLGTEWRDMIGKNLWTEIWSRLQARYNRVVVDDMRFLHEATAVRSLGGAIILLARPGYHSSAEHSSENEFERIVPDFVFNNVGEPEHLLELFNEFCRKETAL